MAQDVISLLFPGDSQELLPRYAEGVRRFRESGGVAPEQLTVSHSGEGLRVNLVWPEGVDHQLLGAHMRGLLDELALPFPQASHGTLATTSWDALTSVGAPR